MRTFAIGIMGVFLMGLAVGPAYSAINTYNTLSEWNAAVTSPATINFNALTPWTTPANVAQGSAAGTVTFFPFGTQFSVVNNAYGSACEGLCLYNGNTITSGMTAVHSSTAVLAFGLNMFTVNSTSQPVNVRVFLVGNAGTTPDYVIPAPIVTASQFQPPTFFGLTSTDPIWKAEVTAANTASTGGYLVIDNYTLSTILAEGSGGGDPPPNVDTPEVPTLGYVGIGFLALIYGSRRRKVSH